MRLEYDPEPSRHTSFSGASPTAGQRRLQQHQWLARFAALLESPDRLTVADCRRLLDLVKRLREEAGELTVEDTFPAPADSDELQQTFQDALGQLDGIEHDLRQRLGVLTPGDPSGTVDLGVLRARMAEAAARREVEELAPTTREGRGLELIVPPANRAPGIFMGIFSFGWLSFTTMHCVLMIGGMAASGLGWAALFLLGFYAIFFAVGIGMAIGAAKSFAREQVEIQGSRLVVRESLGFWTREKEYPLGPDSEAYVTAGNFSQSNQRQAPGTEVAVTTAVGNEVRFGAGRPEGVQRNLVSRINEYLTSLRS